MIRDYKWKVRGNGSGVWVEFDVTAVSRVDDGLVVEAHHRWEHDEALKADSLSG